MRLEDENFRFLVQNGLIFGLKFVKWPLVIFRKPLTLVGIWSQMPLRDLVPNALAGSGPKHPCGIGPTRPYGIWSQIPLRDLVPNALTGSGPKHPCGFF